MSKRSSNRAIGLAWRGIAVLISLLAASLLLPSTYGFEEWTENAGYALSFDGNNDFVTLSQTNQIMHAGWRDTKSVSFWVRPMSSGPCTDDCDLIFSDRPHWWGMWIGERNGLDRIWIWNFDGDGSLDSIGVEYTTGSWVHVTLVHSDGVLRAYRNGFEVGSRPSGTTLQPTDGIQPVLHLGGFIKSLDSNWTFEGELDEVRIWSYPRTPEQVQADMFHSLNGDEPGLLAYYKMTDGSGLTLTEDSGNGWTGTLHDGNEYAPPDGSPPEWVTSEAFDEPVETVTPTSTPTITGTPPTTTPTVTGTPPTTTPTVTGTPPTTTPTVTGTSPTPTPTGTLPTPTPSPTVDPGSGFLRIYVPLVMNGPATP